MGLHFRIYWPFMLNIPYGPHRILITGPGRLCKDGTFSRWKWCWYTMHLDHCCPARIRQRAQQKETQWQT